MPHDIIDNRESHLSEPSFGDRLEGIPFPNGGLFDDDEFRPPQSKLRGGKRSATPLSTSGGGAPAAGSPGSQSAVAASALPAHSKMSGFDLIVGNPPFATSRRTYWSPIYGYIRRRGYSVDDSQDVTQGFSRRF